VDTDKPSAPLQDALLALLDDATPAVRTALLAEFTQEGPGGIEFLQRVARGQDRLLAWHAAWFLRELKFSDPVAEFKGFIRSLNYELETGALLLSRIASPELDVGACCTLLDNMAARCRGLILEPSTVREKCRVLNRVLFHEYGFRGNVEHYTDPLNSFLDQVLQRRKGLPITLSIVYLLVAQRVGLALEPVGLPRHFVVGCYLEDTPFFIDAFDQGAFRTPGELFMALRQNNITPKISDLAPTPVREVLCRCCRNLANHYAAVQDYGRAQLFAELVEEFEATYERHASG
jgi:regulator of sirC expression with transglutaminase-like and TPR domain